MSAFETGGRYRAGDKVRLKGGIGLVGVVAEVTLARTPEAQTLYRVHVPMWPEPLWWECREEEIEVVPDAENTPFKVFDQVRVKIGTGLVGTVTEVHFPDAPDGGTLYRVRIPMEPEPLLLVVRAEAIEKA
jgi:hypothetical protein